MSEIKTKNMRGVECPLLDGYEISTQNCERCPYCEGVEERHINCNCIQHNEFLAELKNMVGK